VSAAAVLVLGAVGASPAAAAAPHWTVSAWALPTNIIPATTNRDEYKVTAHNDGAAPTDGVSPIVLTDTLPPGLTAANARARQAQTDLEFPCEISAAGALVTCTYSQTAQGPLPAGGSLKIDIRLAVEAIAEGSTVTDSAEVAGGGPAAASTAIETPVSSAVSPLGFDTFAFAATDPAGLPTSQAAGHPYALTVNLNTTTFRGTGTLQEFFAPEGEVRDLLTNLPIGLLGNPQAVPRCPEHDLNVIATCPASSQVGVVLIRIGGLNGAGSTAGGGTEVPVYNISPSPGFPAELGFDADAQPFVLYPALRRGDYGLRVALAGLQHLVHLTGSELTIWGVPADPSHDHQRAVAGSCKSQCTYGASAGVEPRPFLTNPSACSDPPQPAQILADAWANPAAVPATPIGNPDFAAADFSEPQWKSRQAAQPPITGCNALAFNPSLTFQPGTTHADSPAGPVVDLQVPQNENPLALATPPLKAAVVTLPQGLAVNPSSADGLAGCTPAQAGAGTTEPATCPPASQIGTVEVETPLLEKPLPGQVFLGTPNCAPCSNQDAQEGKLINLYIQVNDPERGVVVKLPGTVSANPSTGQLQATFAQNPQLPFSDLKLDFKTGPRAPLTTPPTCGKYTTSSDLTPWSAPETPDAITNSSFNVTEAPGGGACAATEAQQPNAPAFSAGTANPTAGAYSPFVLKLSREPGSQVIKGLDVTLPPGLTGRLAGIPYCSDAQIAAAATHGGAAEQASPSCPLASEVGTVNVGAGSGAPFYVQGHAYLAGPYKGAPLSMAIVTPAVAGPFDLGTVVVRAALYVNETTAQIHAVSDPIPTILAGIPLDVRSIALNMNKPNFTLNPTSCNAMAVLGSATSTLGQSAALSSPFQVGDCAALGFKPNLAIALKGGTKRNKNPALTATVTYPKGSYANIASAQVTLPHSEFLDQSHIQTVCTRVQFAAKACPAASIYGHATATTPLLDKPLSGPVYLRSSSNKLPDLVADLNGQIEVTLDGRVDTGKNDGLRNTFELVPDAPVSKFVLSMQGGSKGLLVNSENICKKPQRANVRLTAQNGKVSQTTPLIANSCGAKHKKTHKP